MEKAAQRGCGDWGSTGLQLASLREGFQNLDCGGHPPELRSSAARPAAALFWHNLKPVGALLEAAP